MSEVYETYSFVAGVRCLHMVPKHHSDRVLLFVHGFAATPGWYSDMLTEVASAGYRVVAPQVSRFGLALLVGRRTANHEADDVVRVADELAATGASLTLAGHSRGGQVIWLAAPVGPNVGSVIAIDPVDGHGPRPRERTATLEPFAYPGPVTIVGASLPRICAPPPVNHWVFADSAADHAEHVVLEMGHVDMCDPWIRRVGRLLCRGSRHADEMRHEVSALIIRSLEGQDANLGRSSSSRSEGS